MIEVNLPTLFVIALVAAVGAYFGSYLREKGKNLATKEDVAVISRTTEQIKHEIAHIAWLRQLKWECYSKLVEHFGELYTLLATAVAVQRAGPTGSESADQYWARVNAMKPKIESAFEITRRYGSIARLVVPANVRTRLTRFANDWAACQTVNEEYTLAHQIWIDLLDLGREDLGIEPLENPAARGAA